ncbi:MAG: hypothetical protein AMXMBFR7_45690 [Planctomycetota bacterium]
MSARRVKRVIDASALIQLLEVCESVLALSSGQVVVIAVPVPVLYEKRSLTEERCRALGLEIVRGETEQLLEAAARKGKGGLSFQDWSCVIIAQDAGWGIISEDKPLIKVARKEGLKVTGCFDLLAELYEKSLLRIDDAQTYARNLQANNPGYIPYDDVVALIERLRRTKPKG